MAEDSHSTPFFFATKARYPPIQRQYQQQRTTKNNKSKDIHRSKDNCTGVTEGQAGRQSVNSVLQSGHLGDIGHLGDLDDHVDEHADLVHAVGHGQEDDGSKREVEEKGRPACRLHLHACAQSFLYLFVFKNAQRVLDSNSRIGF